MMIMMILINIMMIFVIMITFMIIMMILIEHLHHQKILFFLVCMYKMFNIDKSTFENNGIKAIYYYNKAKKYLRILVKNEQH